MSKKVCIIRSNPVKPDSRVEKEAISLVRAGFDVHVLAWDRDANYSSTRTNLILGNVSIPITRIGYKASYGEGFKNIVPYLKFQFAMRRFLNQNRFDVIHACDFDTAFFSYSVAKKMKEKFVFDIFDFVHSKPKNVFQEMIKKAQLFLINKADATIICTEDRKQQIKPAMPEKLVVLHNSPSHEQLTFTNKLTSLSEAHVKVVYVGILQEGRLLKEIGEYFANNSYVELHIGGFGLLEDYFENLSEQCENIFYYGRLPYDKTLQLEESCDIMLAIYDPRRANHRYAAPNKFYEALFLGKPVMMVAGTGMSNVVGANDIGAIIDYSIQGFDRGLKALIEKKDKWATIGTKMKSIYDGQYSWEIMEQRLIELYKTL